MKRTSIELITGFTKTGKPQYKKYLAKPIMTMFETIQGSKLSMKMQKAFKAPDFEELTEEQYEELSITEKKEYDIKQDEYGEQVMSQMDILDEVFVFIAEAFDNQFTSTELQKGIPNGQEGFEFLGETMRNITAGGEPSDTKKFVSEKTN